MASFISSIVARCNRAAIVAAVMVLTALFSASNALATAPTPQEVVIDPVIDTASLVTTIFTVAGAGLVAAMGVGGAFIIAKKIYRWMFSKIG